MNHRSRVITHVGSYVQFNTPSWTPSDWFALQVALKCADIGHLAATPDVHKRWAYLLEEEFFLQVLLPANNTVCMCDSVRCARHSCAYTDLRRLSLVWMLYVCTWPFTCRHHANTSPSSSR